MVVLLQARQRDRREQQEALTGELHRWGPCRCHRVLRCAWRIWPSFPAPMLEPACRLDMLVLGRFSSTVDSSWDDVGILDGSTGCDGFRHVHVPL